LNIMTAENTVNEVGKALLAADHKVHDLVEHDRPRATVKVLGVVSDVGDQPQLRLISGGMILAGLLRRDARMIGAGARMLLAHELATATKSAIKHRVNRKRPRSASGKGEEKPRPGHDRDKEESSFPSGHSAGATAVGAAFSAVYPEYRIPALAASSAIALAQIPRRAHYPTDVGVGLAIGALSAGAVGLAWRLAQTGLIRFADR
jgi:membrane-associated phospholipid phosphatase